MPRLIEAPTIITAAGNTPKRIEEYAGRVNSGHTAIAETVPSAQHREHAGQTNNVSPAALAPAVLDFLGESAVM